jgi:hypothetical protein
MQIENQISQLIQNIDKIKPLLENNANGMTKKFDDILNDSIKETNLLLNSAQNLNKGSIIPDWVDPDYVYDPENPRKPNMREMIEAISEKNLENIFSSNDTSLLDTTALQASEILYGVVGSRQDTRDWSKITAADNIVAEVRHQTSLMHNPKVEISTDQKLLLKDKNGEILRYLGGSKTDVEETLLNFGATKESIPSDLVEQTQNNIIDDDILELLVNYNGNENSIQNLVIKTASASLSHPINPSISMIDLESL